MMIDKCNRCNQIHCICEENYKDWSIDEISKLIETLNEIKNRNYNIEQQQINIKEYSKNSKGCTLDFSIETKDFVTKADLCFKTDYCFIESKDINNKKQIVINMSHRDLHNIGQIPKFFIRLNSFTKSYLSYMRDVINERIKYMN